MTAIARLEVILGREGSMSDAVARAVEALDRFDVSYETTPTDTVIEADDVGEVFAAAEAAHRAVGDDRVITSLEVDELRTRSQDRRERVTSVERELGRPPRRDRQESQFESRQRGRSVAETPRRRQPEGATRGRPRQVRTESHQREASESELRRYHGPVQAGTGQEFEGRTTESRTTPRYLQPRRPVSR